MTERAGEQFVLAPNSVIGVLGGGQLARMLSMAAARLGLRTHIYTPEENAPAADVAHAVMIGDYEDENRLTEFGAAVNCVTYEFENVPARTVEVLTNAGVDVAPGARALAISQDRLIEKTFINDLGAKTAPFHAVDDLASLEAGLNKIGRPAILKTRRLGYDGKGQTVIADSAGDLSGAWDEANRKAWNEVGARPSILEGFIDFEMEISVIGARARNGDIAIYDSPRNTHRGGILRTSSVPANAPKNAAIAAREITRKMLSHLNYVGVLGVEFFVLMNGDVIVNEFAPRVHNSGHWTIDACACSQFEQHIRAVAGWPLGDPARHSDCIMENLIGDEQEQWRAITMQSNACLHLYGKRQARPGRKMGHVTHLSKY
ncbi:MAG: 5-(carboxyamino)imidazole ribonucleotide synthase [Parvularculaceae bacterium]